MNLPKLVLNAALIHLMLSHLILANINIEQVNTYLEWNGIVSYADQMLTVPFVWTIPQHEILEVKMECGNKTIDAHPDANIIKSHTKTTDAGLDVDLFEQLCQVDSHFCRVQKRFIGLLISLISVAISAVSLGLNIVDAVKKPQPIRVLVEYQNSISKTNSEVKDPILADESNSGNPPVTAETYATVSKLDDKVNGFIKKYDSLYIKYTEIGNDIIGIRNEMCATDKEMISRILAVEYLAIYWNQYKSILDSALRGEVNHQMLNFEEFKRLVNTVRGIRHNLLDDLNFISMFRTSKYILVKHDPAAPSIHGVLVIPLILKSKSIPVYTPLILRTTGQKYYNLPDIIAISHTNRYRVYTVNKECLLINNEYLCLSNMHIKSQQQMEIEKFLNNEEHSLSTSVATSDENYTVGTHGVYIKSGTPYTIIMNNNGGILDMKNVNAEKNVFIAFQDFDMILIEENSIIGSHKISTELGQAKSDTINTIPILSAHNGRAITVRQESTVDNSNDPEDLPPVLINNLTKLAILNRVTIDVYYGSLWSTITKIFWMFGMVALLTVVATVGLAHGIYERKRLEKSLYSLKNSIQVN